jgi:hypothetical protein
MSTTTTSSGSSDTVLHSAARMPAAAPTGADAPPAQPPLGSVPARMRARLATAALRALGAPERWTSRRAPAFAPLLSQVASAAQADHPRYLAWMEELEAEPETQYHRKIWEWCFILEALQQSGLVAPGSRALGFGVGHERIPAILAARGVSVVGTDLPGDAGDWATSGQHAAALDELRADTICPPERFERLVSFRPVDMNALPEDLTDFDLLWSSCALEHLGDPERGTAFVVDSLRCLRPGGVAVHTTELRVEGDTDFDLGGTVLYSLRTMERLIARLRLHGHHVGANLHIPWDTEPDRFVDEPPYANLPYHFKLRVGGEITTSFGLVVTKRGPRERTGTGASRGRGPRWSLRRR